jgi:hypothetical protein
MIAACRARLFLIALHGEGTDGNDSRTVRERSTNGCRARLKGAVELQRNGADGPCIYDIGATPMLEAVSEWSEISLRVALRGGVRMKIVWMMSLLSGIAGAIVVASSPGLAQPYPGELPWGSLRPGHCVRIKVDRSVCQSGRMRVCSAGSLAGTRGRTCIKVADTVARRASANCVGSGTWRRFVR